MMLIRCGVEGNYLIVMPANAGIQGERFSLRRWIPAFAGMSILS
jgi:hypothetical protein